MESGPGPGPARPRPGRGLRGWSEPPRPSRRVGSALVGVAIVAVLSVVFAASRVGAPGHQPRPPGLVAPSQTEAIAAHPDPGHEVYGFVPYWEIDDTIAAHLRGTDASTIALFSVTNTPKGAMDTRQNGYRAIAGPVGREIVADAHRLGHRVDLTWTSFGTARNDALFGSVRVQDAVIAGLVRLRADLAVDGIAVDVEELSDADIPAWGAFVGRLRDALRTADPRATVTVATGSGPRGAAMALAANLAGVDRIFLMGYDYRTASSSPGATAPLSRGDGVDRSISWSLDLYAAAGVPVTKTILGLPLYGLSWPTTSGAVGSLETGPGSIWVPRRNLAALADPAAVRTYDVVEDASILATPAGTAWRTIYYDTPESLRPKLGYANDHGLAGAGFWALGYERGLPDYTSLIADFRSGRVMTDPSAVP